MTYEKLFKQVTKKLDDQNKIEALKLLLLELTGQDSSFLYLNYTKEAPVSFIQDYLLKADLYLNEHIPVQHILGFSYFYGREFKVNEHVLIPRPETENLIFQVLNYYDSFYSEQKVDVLDLGTGSGAISITLALEEPNMNVTASDISDQALDVARENNQILGANVTFLQSDWLSHIKGKFDIVCANPPYIPESELVIDEVTKEPSLALYGGKNGLVFYETILKQLKPHLKENALVIFEHGYDQKESLHALIQTYFKEASIKTFKDLAGLDRNTIFLLGRLHHDI